MPVGPVLIVNGPIRRQIGMNSGINVLGQGNRANSTIGRALQLVIRNVAGADRAVWIAPPKGNPGKVSFCFPEDEEGSPWEPLHVERGFDAAASTVTLFPAKALAAWSISSPAIPSRSPDHWPAVLRTVQHPKLPMVFDAILVLGPEHGAACTAKRAGPKHSSNSAYTN